MKRRLFVTLAILFALMAVAAHAGRAGNAPLSRADQAASAVAGKSVSVYCETSWNEWLAQVQGMEVVYGYAYIGGSTIYVNPSMCESLHVLNGNGWSVAGVWPGMKAILALVHESFHAKGIANEADTQACAAKYAEQVAVQFFGLPTTEAITVRKTRTERRVVRKDGRRFVVKVKVPYLKTVLVESQTVRTFRLAMGAFLSTFPPAYQGGSCV